MEEKGIVLVDFDFKNVLFSDKKQPFISAKTNILKNRMEGRILAPKDYLNLLGKDFNLQKHFDV